MAKAIREWYCRDCRGEGVCLDRAGRSASLEEEAIKGGWVVGSSDLCLWAIVGLWLSCNGHSIVSLNTGSHWRG